MKPAASGFSVTVNPPFQVEHQDLGRFVQTRQHLRLSPESTHGTQHLLSSAQDRLLEEQGQAVLLEGR